MQPPNELGGSVFVFRTGFGTFLPCCKKLVRVIGEKGVKQESDVNGKLPKDQCFLTL